MRNTDLDKLLADHHVLDPELLRTEPEEAVIPVKTGTQKDAGFLGSRFHGNDGAMPQMPHGFEIDTHLRHSYATRGGSSLCPGHACVKFGFTSAIAFPMAQFMPPSITLWKIELVHTSSRWPMLG